MGLNVSLCSHVLGLIQGVGLVVVVAGVWGLEGKNRKPPETAHQDLPPLGLGPDCDEEDGPSSDP